MFFTIHASAQQKPQYTQYIFNNFLLNPAICGIENYTDIKVGYRNQWTGIKDAPKTSFVTAHWMLGDKYLWSNPLSLPEKGDDPMSRSYMQRYTSSPAHHGVGITAVSDKAAAISRLDVNLSYAYHLQLNNAYNLSLGVAAGISRISLDVDALTLENQNDPALNAINSDNKIKPDLSLGVWLYGSQFFAGVSAQQILPQKLSFSASPEYNQGKEVPHFFLTAGYKLFLDEEITAIPSVMVKYVNPIPVSVDANLKVAFKDKFWIGGSYRKDDSYSGLIGVNISKLVNLIYSYDFTTSELNKVSNGSHEIVLGLQLNNLYKVPSSIRMW